MNYVKTLVHEEGGVGTPYGLEVTIIKPTDQGKMKMALTIATELTGAVCSQDSKMQPIVIEERPVGFRIEFHTSKADELHLPLEEFIEARGKEEMDFTDMLVKS